MGSYNFFINPKNLNLQMARKAMSTQTLCDRERWIAKLSI